jgi:spectinomycin phosphotransferase
MLEKPDLRDEAIVACLREAYGLPVVEVTFLPLGADQHTAVYRAAAAGASAGVYFCKLRGGVFDETSVLLPRFLHEQGIEAIIAPMVTANGGLWAVLGAFKVILYPFVEGRDAYEVVLSAKQWHAFGRALKRVHDIELPPGLRARIRRETWTPRWRETVKAFLHRVAESNPGAHDPGVQGAHSMPVDPVAAQVVALLRDRHDAIFDLVLRAERLAQALAAEPPPFVLCHSDVHAANLLIDGDGRLYIVDWDDPILAPKERDLMFIGGAQGFAGHSQEDQEALFYRGYGGGDGRVEVDPVALAYYRYERIVVDIAVYCEQLLLSDEGGPDREQSLRYLRSNFLPGGTIEVAYRSVRSAEGRAIPHAAKGKGP